jgi:hypothetical protein
MPTRTPNRRAPAAPRADDLAGFDIARAEAPPTRSLPESALSQHLMQADALLADLPEACGTAPAPSAPLPFDELRWFWLPDDALRAGASAPYAPSCPPAAARVRPGAVRPPPG